MKKILVVYLMAFLNFSFSCNQNPEPETCLIPAGFTGRINILFNQKEGMPVKYENGRRLYEIPSDGILLTQFKDEYGWVDHKFYYVSVGGKRTQLKILKDDAFKDSISNVDKSEIGVFSDGTMGQYGGDSDPKAVKFQEFVISSYSGMDSLFTKERNEKFNNELRKVTGLNL